MLSKSLIVIETTTLIVILVFSIGFFPIDQVAVQKVAAQGFVLPCTVTTFGNAWNGLLAFGLNDYLVVMNTNGTLIDLRESNGAYGVVKNIATDTLMFQGEPEVDGSNAAPTYASHIWNVDSNSTQDFPEVIGEHDLEYDPINNTFLTLQDYVREVGNNSILVDKIVEVDTAGNILWSWDSYDHIPLTETDPFNLTATLNGQTVIDFTHANALDWDYTHNVIYLNVRNTNTFYKINQTSGDIIWACGQFGNFTLLGANGTQVSSLWFHSHDLELVAPDVFTMFNNDFDNITNPNDANSQMIELTLNEQNMTAFVNWSWTAPEQYYTQFLGATDILPNGDWIGDFGSPTHQFPENQPWGFNDTGADLIEVNPAGQIVRTITFPTGWLIYRIGLVTNLSSSAFIPVQSASPTTSPSTTPTPTSSPSPTQTLSPTQLGSPTPTHSTQPSTSPSPSSNTWIITGVAIAGIGIAIVLAVFAYLKKRRC